MLKLLLKRHSRVNFRDMLGRTALHFAVMNDNEDIVKLLLCFKADPSVEDNKGESPHALHEAMGTKRNMRIAAHMKLVTHQLFR
mmetsp:Transcript_5756/g.7771  ORF Transcript_5756/g.7771 Transcript_5756/m.7771 type:complete len:84 (-) Transcript_5756:316-567(-)